ncbi:MAG: DUF1460 domain-containing protein [Candidatus Sumerlaeaceae bacterium]|nr:DUF1460 domain-containing protein [Candidatus Sumerlaeaceae bacterium]
MFRGLRIGTVIAAAALCMTAPTANAAAKASAQGVVDLPTAIKAWKVKPKKDETTQSMEKRVRKDLNTLFSSDRKKLEEDGAHWKLLSYLHEMPWDRLPEKWRAWYLETMPNPRLTEEQRAAFIERIKNKPTYKMTPKEVDVYLAYAQKEYPNIRDRVVHFARRNIGQPYKIYLLGEFPNEIYDDQPLYILGCSDCVVFAEHNYAMALSSDWKQFFATLQKIRYKNGEIGMTTRNHYTEADWDKNNSWLVQDVTKDLGATTVTKYTEKIDRAAFFAKFGIGQDFKPEVLHDEYIPADAVPSVLDKLKDGDFVNVVRGQGEGVWVGHVGLIGHDKDGKVMFIHSTPPTVKEQPIMGYVEENLKKNPKRLRDGKAVFLGFKFLRLKEDAKPK